MLLTICVLLFIIILLSDIITNMNSFQLKMNNMKDNNNIRFKNNNNNNNDNKKNRIGFLLSNINLFIQTKVIKIIPTILGATLFIINPLPSFAARSGGRSGGSSFHSSSSRSSSSSSSRSRSSSRRSSSSSSTRLSSGSLSSSSVSSSLLEASSVVTESSKADDALTTLIVGAVILSSFRSIKKESRSLGSGITILKLQISVDMDWSKDDDIINKIHNIAQSKGKIGDRKELATLLSDTSLALLRKKDSFNSASLTSDRFNDDDDDDIRKAESFFQKLSILERSKFESEINPSLLFAKLDDHDNAMVPPYLLSMPSILSSTSSALTTHTQAVVSLIVAIRGSSDTYRKPIRSTVDLSDCLQLLASEALTDNGENIMAVEVLWTPSQPGTIVTDRELISDYPELIKL
jgi:uncharacterized membrane protein